MMDRTWIAILLAMALDLLWGDPQGWPHPVRWMGRAIVWFEPKCRRQWNNDFLAGLIFAVVLITTCWAACFSMLKFLALLHPLAGFLGTAVMLYYCLSIRSLMEAAMEIHTLLSCGQIEAARNKLAWIVSRDVDHYRQEDIARATVETVAENFVDGVLSPLLFALIGGAPLCMAFKMISTLDAMVGYKNERYVHFGRPAARIDDAANFISARLGVLLIAVAGRLLGGLECQRRVWRTAQNEGHHHISPNAGHPEAAFAGALAVRLNGPNYYHGRLVNKPYIGVAFGPVSADHILKACQLMLVASLFSGLLPVAVALLTVF